MNCNRAPLTFRLNNSLSVGSLLLACGTGVVIPRIPSRGSSTFPSQHSTPLDGLPLSGVHGTRSICPVYLRILPRAETSAAPRVSRQYTVQRLCFKLRLYFRGFWLYSCPTCCWLLGGNIRLPDGLHGYVRLAAHLVSCQLLYMDQITFSRP
ncbi:hypothetical protein IscW_ISCW008256 [Ixodes scapularis]|uniref:Uncharacterized protein n=1 Tax=Ixodes scapularis TaxID=6945 RepID=B7PU27_IXOSC|nr:hypothetical protein IscW_ISCW008256 [Ixodes scapularis]|eukprot:XP_002405360.1 hypothetical protein IscW_ISCW008256 [Ixodes scapularis]